MSYMLNLQQFYTGRQVTLTWKTKHTHSLAMWPLTHHPIPWSSILFISNRRSRSPPCFLPVINIYNLMSNIQWSRIDPSSLPPFPPFSFPPLSSSPCLFSHTLSPHFYCILNSCLKCILFHCTYFKKIQHPPHMWMSDRQPLWRGARWVDG